MPSDLPQPPSLRVTPIPCLQDNYAWLLECSQTGALAVVDPSEAGPVRQALGGRVLSAIFLTHHHWDHVGGVPELLEDFPGIPVYAHGSDHARIPGQSVDLASGDSVAFGAHTAHITHIPGHTLGAIAWYFPNAHPDAHPSAHPGASPTGSAGAVFTGDTLFLGGCGRLFEGTPAQMFHSLQVLSQLPDQTRVYVGHEYSVSNLKFALWLDPDHGPTQALQQHYQAQRVNGQPTPPGTVAIEKQTNPFLRAVDPDFQQTVWTRSGQLRPSGSENPALDAFTLARKLKDNF